MLWFRPVAIRMTERPYERIYVIGDIHGRVDLLNEMVGQIDDDLGSVPGEACLTVTLGDYIDRGPDSRGVIERLHRNPFPTRYVALKGNHEVIFESFLRDPTIGRHWCQLGGVATMLSYDVPLRPTMAEVNFEVASETLRATVPEAHLDFIRSLRISLDLNEYFLCHAGIRPGVPFEHQRPDDLLGIREKFLSSRAHFGKIVIHGHTPVQSPEVRPNRINVDTGAYVSGRLTCVVLERFRHRFLTATVSDDA